jgi:hypothetical protein
MFQVCWMSEEGGLWVLEEQIHQWTHASHAQHLLLVLPVNYFMDLCFRSGECQRKVVCEFWRNNPPVDTCKPCTAFATRSNLLIILWVSVSGLVNVRGRWSVSSGGTNPPVDKCKPCTALATRSTCYLFHGFLISWKSEEGGLWVLEEHIHQWTHARHAHHLLLVLTC